MTTLELATVARPVPRELAEPAAHANAEAGLALVQRSAVLLAELERTEGLESVLHLHEQASALSALARAARVGLEQQNQLAMTRVRVQHRAGSMLRQLASEPRPGRAKRPRGKAPLRSQLPRGVLREHGISGQESSQWQSLASLPIADVVRRMDELQANALEITAAEFYRRGQVSLRKRSSRLGASPVELRLRAALTNLARIRALSTTAEAELARKIVAKLREWGVLESSRPDLLTVAKTCLLCGRDWQLGAGKRCACGGSWTSTLR
jgi:hypothetical protein